MIYFRVTDSITFEGIGRKRKEGIKEGVVGFRLRYLVGLINEQRAQTKGKFYREDIFEVLKIHLGDGTLETDIIRT